MAFDANVLSGIKTLADYQQLEQAFRARQQEAQAQQMLVAAKLQNGGADKPSAVAEYEFFKNLPDQASRDQYLTVKRALPIKDLGGYYGVANPVTGDITPVAGGAKTLAPEQLPGIKQQQAYATGIGSGAADLQTKPQIMMATETAKGKAERDNNLQKQGQSAKSTLDLIREAKTLLPKATGGGAQAIGADVNKFAGRSTEATQADSQLDLIAAGLTSSVPRFEGPQGVLDVQLYERAAADVSNREKPREDRLAALNTMEKLQNKYIERASSVPQVDLNQRAPSMPNSKLPAAPTGQIVPLADVEGFARSKNIPIEQAIQHLMSKGYDVQ